MAPKGNQNNKKLKTEDLRTEAYKAYCDHIASGMPKQCFVFRKGQLSVLWKTLDAYMRDYPSEFPASHMEDAIADGYKVWVKRGLNMMSSKKSDDTKHEPAIYQIMMRNIHRWDREDLNRPTVEAEARTLLDKWKNAPVKD